MKVREFEVEVVQTARVRVKLLATYKEAALWGAEQYVSHNGAVAIKVEGVEVLSETIEKHLVNTKEKA